jgi:N4-gp56 family major capsid protein
MPLGSNHVTLTRASAASRTRSNSAFVPELWADEVVANYKATTIMPDLVVTMPFTGQKGDTINVPRPVRGNASAKAAETQVTLIANQELMSSYIINEHWEYSRLIEDIVKIQASDRLRQFYTDDAGFALAKRVDTNLHTEGAGFAGANASPYVAGTNYSKAVIGAPTSGALVAWSASANANAGNAAALTDEGIRLLIKALDDNDVPSMGRVLVVPPVEKKNLLGIARFTEQAFTGEAGAGNSIRNGKVGSLYGVDVFVSTRCNTVADGGAAVDQRAVLFFQKEALILIEQMKPRTQTQYKQEYLSDLFTADIIFDTGLLRPEAGVAVVVPA